ncbi:Bug family tripartite tricarboxylate transporter substrate binding protein [Verticiella sediminum]|nr:tripartite tricarboxylate transporter substrate binding protein [Verticiella sediminum]
MPDLRVVFRAACGSWRSALAAGVLAACSTSAALAGSFPERPVTIIVPFAAGGGSDIAARLIGQRLQEKFGQPFIVENKPGASTQIATRHVITQPGDGYTLLLATTSVINNDYLYKNLAYDAKKSLQPVVGIVDVPAFLAVGTAAPVSSVGEFLEYARQRSEKNLLNYGSAGNASTLHLAGEWFNQAAKLKGTHVAYRGSGPAVVALMAGEVDYSFENLAPALPQLGEGRMRLLAIAGPERFPTVPDVPTLKEFGLPDTDLASWFVLMTHADAPAEVVRTLNEAVNEVLQRADVQQRLLDLGLRPTGGSPQELAQRMEEDRGKWARIIEAGHVTVEQ